MHKALFLDRDGIINEEVGYLYRVEDVRFVPGIFELCREAQRQGYKLVVVTNQSGIARGLYSEAQFHTLMDWMRAQLAVEGVTLDAVYFCPFHPEHGVGSYRREHEDRKPGPGMLLRAAREHDLDLGQSILIGDRCGDLAAAQAAGLRKAFLMAGTEAGACSAPHQQIERLAELTQWLQQAAYA